MKLSYFFLVPLSLLMASCVNGDSFDTSSSFESTKSSETTSSEEHSESLASQSSLSCSSEKEGDIAEVSGPITLNNNDVIDFAKSSYQKGTCVFSFSKAKKNSNGFISLEKGGCFTNFTPFSKDVSSIEVSFTTTCDYASLVSKSSSFKITSPMNGAYELANETPFSFQTKGNYFSLYSPIGQNDIKSIKLEFSDVLTPKEKSKNIEIYTINDTHGAADTIVDSASNKYQSGIKKLSAFLMDAERKKPEEVVALCSGDMWQGGIQSNRSRGKSMIDWMNVTGFESMAIGNHEFDWKPETIEANSSFANFPFLGINIRDEKGNRPVWARPSTIVSRGGARIGVVGAIGDVASSISVSSLSGYSFHWSETAKMVEEEASRLRLQEGCDIVVLSIHGSNSSRPANCDLWNGVDAVLEGHTHVSYSFIDSKGIPHIQTYGNGSNLRSIRFAYDENTSKYKYISNANIENAYLSSLEDEPMASKVYNHYEEAVSSLKNEVLYHTDNAISQSELASFSAKCLYEYYATKYEGNRKLVGASINSGAARQELIGDITYADLINALPFENENVFVNIPLKYFQAMQRNSYYSAYSSDVSGLSINEQVEIVMVSYVSDKAQEQSKYHFSCDDRDGTYYLFDIVADAFREGKYAS